MRLSDEEQARHALSQALYLLRRDTGQECVAGVAQLRLHDDIASDIRDFQDALGTDRLSDAIARYDGEFLRGFFLPDAPRFEQWVEETRARLQHAATIALETLPSSSDRRPVSPREPMTMVAASWRSAMS